MANKNDKFFNLLSHQASPAVVSWLHCAVLRDREFSGVGHCCVNCKPGNTRRRRADFAISICVNNVAVTVLNREVIVWAILVDVVVSIEKDIHKLIDPRDRIAHNKRTKGRLC